MIIVDMSNLAISAIQSATSGDRGSLILNEQVIRHIILKSLIELHKKIGRHHELVLAFDSKNYWRKDYFKWYKGNRKKKDDKFSWDEFYRLYNDFKKELPLYFGYKCIEVDRVEGDDIIYVISEYHQGVNIVIASSDTDDLQIQEKWPVACQYSLKTRKYITPKDYNYTLEDHIIEGDAADGVPNCLSDGDCYVVEGKKTTVLTKGRRAKIKFIMPEENRERYEQNKKIIDMSQIPIEYKLI